MHIRVNIYAPTKCCAVGTTRAVYHARVNVYAPTKCCAGDSNERAHHSDAATHLRV